MSYTPFFVYIPTSQTTCEDCAVWSEKDDVGNALDVVCFGGSLLRIDDLRVGNAVFLDCSKTAFWLVPRCNANNLQAARLVFIVGINKIMRFASHPHYRTSHHDYLVPYNPGNKIIK